MFSMAVEKSPIARRNVVSGGDLHEEKDPTFKEPPKTRKKVSVKTQDVQNDFLKVITKLKTLPRINQEFNACALYYQRFKTKHTIIGFFLNVLEFYINSLLSVVHFFMMFPAIVQLIKVLCDKAKFIDDFLSHQLDFVETQLQKVEVGFLFKRGGIIDQLLLLNTLVLRILFIWPRFCMRLLTAFCDEATHEYNDNVNMLMKVIYPTKARRSKRQRNIQGSPGKKRKHEELEEGLPEYMICFENYREEDDSDYIPGSGDDTEITSATEGEEESQTEETEENGEHVVEMESPSKQDTGVKIPFIENTDTSTPIL